MSRNRIWPGTRAKVFERDRMTCFYCEEMCVRTPEGASAYDPIRQREPTIDHIIPRIDGGSSRIENLVTACRRCNTLKGRRSPAWLLERLGTAA